MFIEMNANPKKKSVGDCVIRAICVAENKEWDDIYLEVVLKGFEMKDIPSSNAVWGSYLKELGYARYIVPNTCPDCYTITDFVRDNPIGTYILATGTHVVVARDGSYMDTWDSGQETVIYYFEKEN